jgi:heme exporter protein D
VMFGAFFWPAFVILGTGINLVQTLVRRQDIVDQHVRRLERKQAKEVERRQRRELEGRTDEDDDA